MDSLKKFLQTYWLWLVAIIIGIFALAMIVWRLPDPGENKPVAPVVNSQPLEWNIPDTLRIPHSEEGDLIRYGKSLVSNTSFYLGPRGTVGHYTNGMNCQNCHLDAGTRFMGNNYSAVYSTYPKFRERSGSIETINKRINDCIERSLNGKALDSGTRELSAIYAYIKWLGKFVPPKQKPAGAGIAALAFLDRPADPAKGKNIYASKCQRCHGIEGQGLFNPDSTGYVYPPLWGPHSFNTGAGLFRLSRLAGYVRYNMPFGVTYDSTDLNDEEAWDVAAFVNSQPRPQKPYPQDWPKIAAKPFDHPFGPFADLFDERQHKFGPFGPIVKTRKQTP